MSIYYPSSSCSGGTVPDYYCTPCLTYEYGRIRHIALISTSYIDTLLASPTSATVWQTGITNGSIFVLYKTQGSYDGGSTSEIAGFGDAATTNGNTTHTLTFKDPNYAENCDFYNELRASADYTLAYVTSDSVHFSEEVVTFSPKNPVQDDINSIVTWEVLCKWTNNDSPCAYAKPTGNFFDTCYIHS